MIKCNINNERYIGSSMCKNKNDRLSSHKCKNNKCVSKQIINRNNYEYIILEDILDIDKKQLRIKEQEYIDKYDCINKQRAYLSEEQENKYQEQWRKNNKEYIKEYNKKYHINNKDYKKKYIKEYQKLYRQNNKENNKEYMKEYYFFNKYNDVIAQFINEINKY